MSDKAEKYLAALPKVLQLYPLFLGTIYCELCVTKNCGHTNHPTNESIDIS